MIDVASVRADTPACEQIIHFDSAGASLMPDPVYNAINAHLELERKVGGYEAERLAADQLEGFYGEFAALLGCAPQEIDNLLEQSAANVSQICHFAATDQFLARAATTLTVDGIANTT